MRNRIYICAVIFIGLTAAKLLLPEYSQTLRLQVAEILTRNDDYTQIVETMGRELTDTGFGWELIEVIREKIGDGADEFGLVPGYANSRNSELQAAVAPEREKITEPDKLPTEERNEAELPAAVSAFIASQAKFTGYELPENVSVDMPELPFAYTSPVAGSESSGFGYRMHPIDNEVKFHYGTDFAANSGDAVEAFADGFVYAAGTSEGYGNYLILTHEGGFSTIYAHLSRHNVQEGDAVRRGETIGLVGQTGIATGPHLHFELLKDEVYINPEYYL